MINNNYLSKNFGNAVKDYYYLLGRDYPQKATIKLIGDRYRLTGIERSVLLRGIVKKEIAFERKKKILKELTISNRQLIIDCYNVLITINTYLNGNFIYISNVLKGDLGTSIQARIPVSTMIKQRLPNSVKLAFFSITISLLIALFLGVTSAVKKGSFIDVLSRIIAVSGMSIPSFWLGIMFILIFGACSWMACLAN